MLKTIAKAGEVLGLFDGEVTEWGVAEVATALAVPKSSAHDLLRSLTGIGLLRCVGGRYRLGYRLLTMSGLMQDEMRLRRVANGVMARVSKELGETTHLAVAGEDGRIMFAHRVLGSQGLVQRQASVGSELPGHCTGSGKLFMTEMPAAAIARLVNQGLDALTQQTITDVSGLFEELDRTETRQIAYNFEESNDGIVGVAVPVRDSSGGIAAALGISMPLVRVERFRREYERRFVRFGKHLSTTWLDAPARVVPQSASVAAPQA